VALAGRATSGSNGCLAIAELLHRHQDGLHQDWIGQQILAGGRWLQQQQRVWGLGTDSLDYSELIFHGWRDSLPERVGSSADCGRGSGGCGK